MVADRTTDGVRIAQLLASELVGDGDALAAVRVSDADPDVEPTTQGTLAYRVRLDAEDEVSTGESEGAGRPLAEVYVHPERAHVEFVVAPDAAATAAEDSGLRVRPKAVTPPRTVVFVEDGAQVKRVLPAFEAVVSSDAT
ncbi:hypothetical protein [Halobaculum magnesiiphilum]|uniref:DUF7993 domain-containing protein n=1 Tax=Halobaculum magnesiiphilum TaxID=1017351 RepID=A0A8T8WC41_9EURY|nr:hypothetical protein [Halobaculum magnesiiphilum]QZP37405.1 hypothetical protein K6T50_14180 [Halobaculum magnesiiphilum]